MIPKKSDPVSLLARWAGAIHRLNREAERETGLSVIQAHLLSVLRDLPGASPMELSAETKLHPSTLTPVLQILRRKRAIFIDAHPLDRRRKVLGLTKTGLRNLQAFESRFRAVAQRELGGGKAPPRLDPADLLSHP